MNLPPAFDQPSRPPRHTQKLSRSKATLLSKDLIHGNQHLLGWNAPTEARAHVRIHPRPACVACVYYYSVKLCAGFDAQLRQYSQSCTQIGAINRCKALRIAGRVTDGCGSPFFPVELDRVFLILSPTPGNQRQASPYKRDDESLAKSVPRGDPVPILPSSAGIQSLPANDSSTSVLP